MIIKIKEDSFEYDNKENQKFNHQKKEFKKYQRIVNQILDASTIHKSILAILQKLCNKGKKFIKQTEHTMIYNYGKEILESLNLQNLMNLLDLDNKERFYNFEQIIEIIKYFVLNQQEKEYIDKIFEDIRANEKLENEVNSLMNEVEKENIKKMDVKYKDNPNTKKLTREIDSYENKLEKAHQKLNSIIFQNSKLREKIDLLRKEKNIVEEIYMTLKNELEEKKTIIDKTIIDAGRAHINRNIAENELKNLIEKAQFQKEEFEKEYEKINDEIQHDKKFCQFLKEKHKEKEKLTQLEEEIKKNQDYIKEKKTQNEMITKEYEESSKKEAEIRKAFEQVKKETGINKFEDLLPLFKNLHEKNNTIHIFVKDLTEELKKLDTEIEEVKEKIKIYNIGDSGDNEKDKLKEELALKIKEEEKKRQILDLQYTKSLETIKKIKSYLIELFTTLDIEKEKIDELKNCSLTAENLIQYFGILEEKGMKIISDFSKIIANQIGKEKGNKEEVNEQIKNLLNIIEYENQELLNRENFENKNDFPDYLFENEKRDIGSSSAFRNYDELKQKAMNELWKKPKMNATQKKR